MARKRMISLDVVDTDSFIEMPVSARLLYYDLCVRADDDGFISSPKKIQRIVGCTDDDYKILATKKFIIPFKTGIVVIRHWRIHNTIQKDRYKETIYSEEKQSLLLEDNGMYTKCIQDVYNMETQIRLDKIRLDKISKDILSSSNEQDTAISKKIIDYLNKKTNKHFKYTKNNMNKIKTRIKDGFKEEDFISVIDKKTSEWLNDNKMNCYLRPDTLFGTKFESYLNQQNKKSKIDLWLEEEMEDEEK